MRSAGTTIRPKTRDAILDAAILVLSGNSGAPLAEIALLAGVSRMTLHRHFQGREDLIAAILEKCIREVEEATAAVDDPAQPAEKRLLGMFRAVIPLGNRYQFLGHETAGGEALQERHAHSLDWVAELVEELKADGRMASDVSTSWAVGLIDHLVWIAWSEVSEGRLALNDAPEVAMRSLMHGLAPMEMRK